MIMQFQKTNSNSTFIFSHVINVTKRIIFKQRWVSIQFILEFGLCNGGTKMRIKIKYNPYDILEPWMILFVSPKIEIYMCSEKTLKSAYRQAEIYAYYMQTETRK